VIEGICKLCLQMAPLLDSHYLPKRLYSMNMERSLKNPNPVTLANGRAKQVSGQLRVILSALNARIGSARPERNGFSVALRRGIESRFVGISQRRALVLPATGKRSA